MELKPPFVICRVEKYCVRADDGRGNEDVAVERMPRGHTRSICNTCRESTLKWALVRCQSHRPGCLRNDKAPVMRPLTDLRRKGNQTRPSEIVLLLWRLARGTVHPIWSFTVWAETYVASGSFMRACFCETAWSSAVRQAESHRCEASPQRQDASPRSCPTHANQ